MGLVMVFPCLFLAVSWPDCRITLPNGSHFPSRSILNSIMMIIVGIFVIAAIVIVDTAIRKVPIHYAKRVSGSRLYGGQSTHLPLRLNQAGVIPIIFAVSLILNALA
jgi:preprotein translocase subunit SecY